DADLLAMPFRRVFDVVFSTATLHWVLPPADVYKAIARVLVAGGRLHAQCGGERNIDRFHRRVSALCTTPRYAARFSDGVAPWAFLSATEVERYLREAGFERVKAWLEPEPTHFPDRESFRVFVENVVLGAWMTRFNGAPGERAAFIDTLCDEEAAASPPFMLDYVRLNIEAPRGGASRCPLRRPRPRASACSGFGNAARDCRSGGRCSASCSTSRCRTAAASGRP